MHLMVQPPDHHPLAATQPPAPRHSHELSTPPAGSTLRGRLRDLMSRTTLGPRLGDHVVGESQWGPRAAVR